MEPLSWSIVATLIAKYGLPFVEQLVLNISTNQPVSPENWNALIAKINTPFNDLVPKP